jgi:hypothetical protein
MRPGLDTPWACAANEQIRGASGPVFSLAISQGWIGLRCKEHSVMSPSAVVEQSPLLLALRRSPIPALRKLSIEETESTVVLFGALPSYYLKQLAQETVMPELSGRELHNRVTVVRQG